MNAFLENLISSGIVAFVALVLASLAFRLLRTHIEEHIRQSVKHGFDLDLEEFRDDLSRLSTQLNSVQTAANAALVEGQRASAERRIKAVDELWREIVRIRDEAPPAITVLDVLLPTELNKPDVQGHLREMLPRKDLGSAFRNSEIEVVRPFVGEQLFLQFYVYRAVSGRIVFLLEKGLESDNVTPWYDDQGIHQLLGYVLTEEEIEQLRRAKISQVHWMQNAVEDKILRGLRKLIAGEVSSEEGLAQAQRNLEAVRAMERSDVLDND